MRPNAETNGEPLNVRGALETLQRLEGLEIGLYQRTEGITWMLWGLVTAGIYFTFGMWGSVFEDDMPVWATLSWLPWTVAGVVATIAIWRSAHLAGGAPFTFRAARRFSFVYFAVYLALFGLAFFLLRRIGDSWSLREPGLVMIVLGLASTAVAFLTTSSRPARTMLLAVGAVAVVTALALALVPYSLDWQPYAYQTFGGVAVVGGGWFVGGLWLTAKG